MTCFDAVVGRPEQRCSEQVAPEVTVGHFSHREESRNDVRRKNVGEAGLERFLEVPRESVLGCYDFDAEPTTSARDDSASASVDAAALGVSSSSPSRKSTYGAVEAVIPARRA